MTKILEIALPLPVDKLFSYFHSEEDTTNYIGKRALVNLGKRTLTGIIVAEKQTIDVKGLKKIIELLDDSPIFTNEMLEFTRWISVYYLCSWGEALKAALPQGMSPKSVLKIKLLKDLDSPEFHIIEKRSPKRADLLRLLAKHNDYVSVAYLEGLLKSTFVEEQLNALETAGFISCERQIEKQSKPIVRKAVRLVIPPDPLINKGGEEPTSNNHNLSPIACKGGRGDTLACKGDRMDTLTCIVDWGDTLKEICKKLDKSAPKQSAVLLRIFRKQNEGPVLINELCKELNCSTSVITILQKKGLIEIYDQEIIREEYNDNNLSTRNELRLPLTNEQSSAVERIVSASASEVNKAFLIYGVTGSGKTLVYMHIIQFILNKGQDALVLVPEISLTPQLIDRFRMAFPNICVVLHSRMSQGERYDAWRQVQDGKAKVIVGARSAIFAPLQNLGLIIVDEEHEPSYKQDNPNPRYNARDCALIRGKIEGATVVLGSATPSLESMYNAKIGRYELLTISERADGAKMPTIKLINTLDLRKKGAMVGSLSKELIEELAQRVKKKEGSIVFQNRRGFSAMLECPDCGYVNMCVNCSVSLTYHKAKKSLVCHYCGHTISAMLECPRCGSPEMNVVGFGTQRIEDEIASSLKDMGIEASIVRMDLDTTRKKGAHRKILFDFANGTTDILVGTQMVAKGLDFERVTLVAVVNADRLLYFPDFRSGERAFQLITQVAGRAGRTGKLPGQVLIQSAHPEHSAIRTALLNDYFGFYENEISERKTAHYPPFSRFVLIEFSGKSQQNVIKYANEFYKNLPINQRFMECYPPAIPLIEKIRNEYRRVIIIKNPKQLDPSGKLLQKQLKEARAKFGKEFGTAIVKIRIDIDSFSSL